MSPVRIIGHAARAINVALSAVQPVARTGRAALDEIEVKMTGVVGVGARTEDGREGAARPLAYRNDERVLRNAVAAVADCDPALAVDLEGADVDRVAVRVFGKFGGRQAVAVAA